MYTTRLDPAYKDYIWGGNLLEERYGKKSGLERTAESWELSLHPDGECRVRDGVYAGMTLKEALGKDYDTAVGSACRDFPFFPVLIKLIDAKNDLSVQVHPSDEYALANEGQFGKTEMWYIIEAAPDAKLVYGFRKEISPEEMILSAKNGSITELLNYVPVQKGDVFFIPSGTVHAIGKGLLICEIQQNSNLTYRLFDYNRPGADGKPRPLHLDKAAKVANRTLSSQNGISQKTKLKKGILTQQLADCRYFTTEKLTAEGSGDVAESDSFVALTVLEGTGTVSGLCVCPGDTVFIPASEASAPVTGLFTALKTYISH